MVGLTEDGLRAKIKDNRLALTEDEAVDMFFLFPNLVDITWENGNVVGVNVSGLNLEFSIGA